MDLPQPIVDDLFNSTADPEISLVNLTDAIQRFGFNTEDILKTDVLVRICFSHNNVVGMITINRITKMFTIEATGHHGCFLPYNGSWNGICTYMTQLHCAIQQGRAENA